jgi:hypothetical protein
MKTLLLLSLLFSAKSFAAATPVQIAFTTESSLAFIKLMKPEVKASSAQCEAQVNRPAMEDDALITASNRILCRTNGGALEFSLKDDAVEAWGTHFEKYSFSFAGPEALQMQEKFKTTTVNMTEAESANSIWSRFVLCDSVGKVCFATYVLSDAASSEAPGKVFCTQETEQTAPGEAASSSSQVENPAQYYEDRIALQLKQGIRKVVRTFCAVQN